MFQATWINLPAADLGRAAAFFEALGLERFEMASGDSAVAYALSEGTYVMLHTAESIGGFASRPLADASASTEVVLGVQLDSRAAVDALAAKAVAAGGRETRDAHTYAPMYGRTIEDLDHHLWEIYTLV